MVCISVTNPCRASTQAFRSKVEFPTRCVGVGGWSHFSFLRLTVSQGYYLSLHLCTTCALNGRLLLFSKVFCDCRPSDTIQFILRLSGSQGSSVPHLLILYYKMDKNLWTKKLSHTATLLLLTNSKYLSKQNTLVNWLFLVFCHQ